ncbi:hypothetical protein QVD17_19565 [Tagetes erecta]|uniref:Uncharacterized protein n=1 Tax=Tagetes erecta TaxID=13708 RepID=A0AAD8KJM2_TARER|nr:hypothetical protein QVD17_19565 [Tagetes erecta]
MMKSDRCQVLVSLKMGQVGSFHVLLTCLLHVIFTWTFFLVKIYTRIFIFFVFLCNFIPIVLTGLLFLLLGDSMLIIVGVYAVQHRLFCSSAAKFSWLLMQSDFIFYLVRDYFFVFVSVVDGFFVAFLLVCFNMQ